MTFLSRTILMSTIAGAACFAPNHSAHAYGTENWTQVFPKAEGKKLGTLGCNPDTNRLRMNGVRVEVASNKQYLPLRVTRPGSVTPEAGENILPGASTNTVVLARLMNGEAATHPVTNPVAAGYTPGTIQDYFYIPGWEQNHSELSYVSQGRTDYYCKNVKQKQRFDKISRLEVGRHLRMRLSLLNANGTFLRDVSLKFRIQRELGSDTGVYEVQVLRQSDPEFKSLVNRSSYLALNVYKRTTIDDDRRFDYARDPIQIKTFGFVDGVDSALTCTMNRAGAVLCDGNGLPQLMASASNRDKKTGELRRLQIGRSKVATVIELDQNNRN